MAEPMSSVASNDAVEKKLTIVMKKSNRRRKRRVCQNTEVAAIKVRVDSSDYDSNEAAVQSPVGFKELADKEWISVTRKSKKRRDRDIRNVTGVQHNQDDAGARYGLSVCAECSAAKLKSRERFRRTWNRGEIVGGTRDYH
jgi:hypothetical protein